MKVTFPRFWNAYLTQRILLRTSEFVHQQNKTVIKIINIFFVFEYCSNCWGSNTGFYTETGVQVTRPMQVVKYQSSQLVKDYCSYKMLIVFNGQHCKSNHPQYVRRLELSTQSDWFNIIAIVLPDVTAFAQPGKTNINLNRP